MGFIHRIIFRVLPCHELSSFSSIPASTSIPPPTPTPSLLPTPLPTCLIPHPLSRAQPAPPPGRFPFSTPWGFEHLLLDASEGNGREGREGERSGRSVRRAAMMFSRRERGGDGDNDISTDKKSRCSCS